MNALPNDVREASFAATALIRLPAQKPPWQSTGIQVLHGQSYSLFAAGRIQWSPRHPTLFGGPRFHLWARVAPGGRIVNLTTETGTFMADVSGEVELGLYMGLWKNDAGELATGTSLYDALQGHIDVLAIAWRGAAKPALSAVASATAPPTFIADELVRIAANIAPPDGWRYLLETGHAEIFTDALDAAGRRTIKLDAQDDQGIVRKPVEFALTPNAQISWRWRMLAQPSARAEDSVHTHDYVSIAAEFDNGRDLTWIWSSALAPGTHFDCPIRAWTARETHWVVRSGTAAIGEWCAEHRNVFVDVSVAMGTPPPRIVAVWLIGVSTFQHGTARTEFADIVLHNASGRLQVL
ncbi:MAG: DUF3047 domain-containing protein [Betaproteobacteria bacterium]